MLPLSVSRHTRAPMPRARLRAPSCYAFARRRRYAIDAAAMFDASDDILRDARARYALRSATRDRVTFILI